MEERKFKIGDLLVWNDDSYYEKNFCYRITGANEYGYFTTKFHYMGDKEEHHFINTWLVENKYKKITDTEFKKLIDFWVLEESRKHEEYMNYLYNYKNIVTE